MINMSMGNTQTCLGLMLFNNKLICQSVHIVCLVEHERNAKENCSSKMPVK